MLWVMPSLPIISQFTGGLNAEAVGLYIVWLLNSPGMSYMQVRAREVSRYMVAILKCTARPGQIQAYKCMQRRSSPIVSQQTKHFPPHAKALSSTCH